MFKKILLFVFGAVLVLNLVACTEKKKKDVITVGTIAGPETQLMAVAKKVASKRYGLDVKIKTFSDYNIPNEALNSGEIDANAFQHMPFLEAQVKERGYKIVSIGKTFIYPMGLYSKKIKHLPNIKPDSTVAIPNDPSNEGRALLLLQKSGLIKLNPKAGFDATPADIVDNPLHLKFIELDASELPRALNDVALAAINTTYAIPAGLSPAKDALFHESSDSPYANVIAVRAKDKNNSKLQELVKAYQSPAVIQEAKKLFGDGAIPAWKTDKQ